MVCYRIYINIRDFPNNIQKSNMHMLIYIELTSRIDHLRDVHNIISLIISELEVWSQGIKVFVISAFYAQKIFVVSSSFDQEDEFIFRVVSCNLCIYKHKIRSTV